MKIEKSANRIEYIDCFRACGIVFMIMGHIGFGYIFDKFIHAFHMPMFFLISGFFIKGFNNSSVKRYIVKKAKSLLLPYIFWGCMQYVIWMIVHYPKFDITPLINLFFVNSDGLAIAGALWFLTAMFFADIIYFVIRKFVINKNIYNLVIIIIALLGNIENIVFRYKFPFSLGAGFVGVGLIHLGWEYKQLMEKVKINYKRCYLIMPILIILMVGGVFINGSVNMRIGEYSFIPLFWVNAVLATIIGMNLCKLLEKKVPQSLVNKLAYIGNNSIVYLCLNQLVIICIKRIINNINCSILISKILILIITLIFLKVISLICMNTKLKVLFGKS